MEGLYWKKVRLESNFVFTWRFYLLSSFVLMESDILESSFSLMSAVPMAFTLFGGLSSELSH